MVAQPIAMGKRIIILVIAAFFESMLPAQEIRSLQEIFLEAEYFFINEDYADALPYYLQIHEMIPDNANIAYRIGSCYLNIEGRKNLAIDYLETAARNMSARHKEGTISQVAAPYDALYELGRAYLINYRFGDAKETFTRYSGTLLSDDRENRAFISQNIRSCEEADELISKPVDFILTSLGNRINDENSNFNPVLSDDGRSFAFMVSLKFYDAIMLSSMVNGNWSIPVNITPELQSDGNMYISCLSDNGKSLYLSKNDDYDSDIYKSTFDGIRWGKTIKLNSNINTKYWESHGYVTEDGNQFIFASDRPGGFGGLDLYISRKVNNNWGPAVNLGPEINTPFNEDRPFLINNGNTLFFSSQGHFNMGGYDLFRSELQPSAIWSKPQNLGYPLNTPDDNIFYMPTHNGNSGYYSIYNEAGGEGKEDIYLVTFR